MSYEQLVKVKVQIDTVGHAKFNEEFFDIKNKTKVNYQIFGFSAVSDSIGGIPHREGERTQRVPLADIGKKVDSVYRNEISPGRNIINFYVYSLNRKEDRECARDLLRNHIAEHLRQCQISLDILKKTMGFL